MLITAKFIIILFDTCAIWNHSIADGLD